MENIRKIGIISDKLIKYSITKNSSKAIPAHLLVYKNNATLNFGFFNNIILFYLL